MPPLEKDALCLAELGTLVPASGGEHAYLCAAADSLGRPGDFVTFMSMWGRILLADPMNAALQSLTFTSYALTLLYPTCQPPYAVTVLVAVAFATLATAVNGISLGVSTKLQNILVMGKLAMLLSIIGTGIAAVSTGTNHMEAPFISADFTAIGLTEAYFAAVMSMEGGAAICNIGEEVKNPSQTIPRALILSSLVVTALYIFTNLAYFVVLEPATIASTDATAIRFAVVSWGTAGALVIPILATVSTFGTLSAGFFSHSRLGFAASRRGHLPSFLSLISIKSTMVACMAEEMSDPSRTIPRSLLGGLFLVTVLVVLTNVAYFVVLDLDSVMASEATAVTFARTTWGMAGVYIVPVIVCVCAFGTMSSSFLSHSRLLMAAARKRHLPWAFSLITMNSSLPIVAIASRCCLAILFAVTGSVGLLAKGGMTVFSLMTIMEMLAMLRLRVTMKDADRPIRVPTWLVFVNIAISLVVVLVPVLAVAQYTILEPLLGKGFIPGIFVMLPNVTGSMIFIAPSIVYKDAGSGGADLLVWMTGGLASLAHALCIAELGTLLPSAGGPYEYVNAAAKSMGRAGELLVFFYLWTFLLTDPVAVSLNGLTFTRYAFSLVYGTCPPPHGATALVTVCVIELAAVVNVFSLKASMKTQNIFFALKLAVLLGIIITGTVWCVRGLLRTCQDSKFSPLVCSASIVFMAEEMSDPSRIIPKSVVGGTVLVTGLVVLTNAAYFVVLDPGSIAASEATASTFSREAWGTAGEIIVPAIVCICSFGTLSAIFFTNSRLFMAAARQGHLPSFINLISVKSSLPVVAIALKTCIALPFALTGSVTFLAKSSMTFYCFNVVVVMVAMLRLRVTMKDAARPVRVPTWLVFVNIGVSLTVILFPLFSTAETVRYAFSIGCLFVGLPVYILVKTVQRRYAGEKLHKAAQKLFLSVPCADCVKLK
ncbi:uncharacterized protein [Dermacentor andersoni]|uniref:uncharacterized protein n=1 Tax=Dermacentor andersoni TaxID=34620 RepID=UPI003B3A2DDE